MDRIPKNDLIQKYQKEFELRYNVSDFITSIAPGRINIIGEHTDYNLGLAMPIAIDRWICVIASKREDDLLRIYSSNYKEEISTCRTFCVFEEISKLQESNLAIGGNLDNAVIFSDKSITIKKIKDFNKKNKTKINESIKKNNFTINNKKLFFDNEPVRHKILDLIGDFSLLGKSIKGHIISYKGSHKVNIDILNKIDKIMINKNKNNDSFQYNKEEIQNFIPHRKPFLFIDKIIDGKNGEYVCAIKYVNKKG